MCVVTFEGIDGSGKSSISFALYERLAARGLRVAWLPTRGEGLRPPDGASRFAVEHLAGLGRLIWPGTGSEWHHELGYEYWLWLVGAYFGGLTKLLAGRVNAEYDLVIVESWYHKFAAKLRLKGLDETCLRGQLAASRPDHVFLIDTPPALAWAQKRAFSYVELGGQDGYDELGRDSFLDYQGRLRELLLAQAVEEDWTVLDNGAGVTPESICRRIEARLALEDGDA